MRKIAGAVVVTVILALGVLATTAHSADPVEIPLTIENNQFQPAEIKVKAGEPFVIVVTNKNPKAAEFESKDLRVEKVVPPGKTVKIRVRALKAGSYAFIDDFNPKTTGRIVAE
jgi:uncharacterized cupredoxin-like copper-binding protein